MISQGNLLPTRVNVMSQLANDWLKLLVMLPPADRAEIAERLLDSLDEPADPDWKTAWRSELEKRAERMKSGAVKGIPFDEVMTSLRKKYA
jgi:putative addiction module component (TIGR02574 family)